MSDMRTLKARVYLGRGSMGNTEPGEKDWRLELTDEASGIRVLEFRMNAQDISDLMSTRTVAVDAQWWAPELLGHRREVKHELLVLPDFGYVDHDRDREGKLPRVRAALAPYEVDGWRADLRSATNHHNVVARDQESGAYQVRVLFHRFVDPNAPAVPEADPDVYVVPEADQ